ncbi:hypothetical protein [Acetobacter thailandicus]|uniref:hypothetical protein n=1 Tax=Acetobacter thailandicus TaxID=1502842 RepID=UPI001BAC5156|nr:hypothetical protein [Acetobacter thailandicus]MBS0986618.1 hypothetical protein [Acetobacter thailandicus]
MAKPLARNYERKALCQISHISAKSEKYNDIPAELAAKIVLPSYLSWAMFALTELLIRIRSMVV